MFRIATAFFAAVSCFILPTLSAQALDSGFVRKVIVEQDIDYYGFDLQTLKKVSLERCQTACVQMQALPGFHL